MSNYRTHAIAGIVMALPFVPDIFYLFFALIGASICDLDHDNNRHKVNSMMITGVVLSVILFFFNSSSISALILVILSMIFYISKHRGFTHTLLGIILLPALFLFMIMGFISFFNRIFLILNIPIPHMLVLFVTMAIAGFFVISRKYYILYFIVLGLYLYVIPLDYSTINWTMALVMLFVGAMSHIILDLLTPAGLNLFEPFSSVECHKKWALGFVVIWIIMALFVSLHHGLFFTHP
ncbi:MAG: metal-dependent hydrolase [Methanosphaera sp.]|uniref:metal-dependent hydrolase n=1 Tax=Methanosphaera sp. BMS TaxID=1789762 RepID=UPI000DD44388|nr:metal-dependent hydrolase [Methanosphaera sp. BMS]MBQ6443856.1 metal-dependent hydrolase [Methanosphaera sp.]